MPTPFKVKHKKKVGSGRTKHKIRDLQRLELRHAVYDMRLEWMSQADIGKVFGLSQRRVSQIIDEAVKERAQEWTATQDEHTKFEVERIEKLIAESNWFKKSQTQPRIAEVFLKWAERRDRLLGLYAANKHELSGPNGSPLGTTKFNWDALTGDELQIYEWLTAKLQGVPFDPTMRCALVLDSEMPEALERDTRPKVESVEFDDDLKLDDGKPQ
jgi:predicted transcriptional regulator